MKFRRESDHSSVSDEGYRISLYKIDLQSIYVALKGRERVHEERGTVIDREGAAVLFEKCREACVKHWRGQ